MSCKPTPVPILLRNRNCPGRRNQATLSCLRLVTRELRNRRPLMPSQHRNCAVHFGDADGPQAPGTFGSQQRYLTGPCTCEGKDMSDLIYYAIAFLMIAAVAAFFSLGGLAGFAMYGVLIVFWGAIVLAMISFVAGLVRRT